MTTTFPGLPTGGGSGGGSSGGGSGGGGSDPVGQSVGVLARRNRKRTSTTEKAEQANVPTGTEGAAIATGAAPPDRKKRKRDAVVTGAGEEPNVYRPQLTGY